jgi:hypothetical protein
MKHTKYILYSILVIFSAAGLAACSQNTKTRTKTNETTSPKAKTASITMYRNPGCQCCEQWAAYMEKHGFSVTIKSRSSTGAVKDKYKVPNSLKACHTALIDGYVVEGHVPVEAINKMLKEQPDIKGIAVPGMPAGAPGGRGNRAPVKVYSFNGQGKVTDYGTY